MKRAVGVSPDFGISYISKTWSTFVVDITPLQALEDREAHRDLLGLDAGNPAAVSVATSAGARAPHWRGKSDGMSFIWSISLRTREG